MTDAKYNYSLAAHYAKASLIILIMLTVFVGWWINHTIRKQVIDNTARNAALYTQSFIEPELQFLKNRNFLRDREIDHFKQLLTDTPLGRKIRSLKIWTLDGKLLFHPDPNLIGQEFELTQSLISAASGKVAAEFDDSDPGQEDHHESQLNVKLLEIYTPVQNHQTGETIAIAEFYQEAEAISEQLKETRNLAWLIVLSAMLIAYGLLFIIVWRGNNIIHSQRTAIHDKLNQLHKLLDKNKSLSHQLRQSLNNNTENNERMLTRLSADLHDGPAQYLGFALLRLDALSKKPANIQEVTDEIKKALTDSLTELRNISKGMALPKIANMTIAKIASIAVKDHKQRTESPVSLSITPTDNCPNTSMPIKIALYRSIQEGLNNAFRHASGIGQKVIIQCNENYLNITISDSGKGFEVNHMETNNDSLGLRGLHERIIGLGGDFSITSVIGKGTELIISVPLTEHS